MFKYLLYLLNLVFVAGGILLIVVGSIMLSTMGNFTAFDGGVNTQTIPICIIVIGSVTFVVAFFGCCGTIRENACCTTIVSTRKSPTDRNWILNDLAFLSVRHLHADSVRPATGPLHLDLRGQRQVPVQHGQGSGQGVG